MAYGIAYGGVERLVDHVVEFAWNHYANEYHAVAIGGIVGRVGIGHVVVFGVDRVAVGVLSMNDYAGATRPLAESPE